MPASEQGLRRLALMVNVVFDRLLGPEEDEPAEGDSTAKRAA